MSSQAIKNRQVVVTAMDAMKEQLLRDKEVAEMLNVSTNTVWRWVRDKAEGFPKPVKIGMRATRWKLSEIQRYLEAA